jgi:hypothetical protein
MIPFKIKTSPKSNYTWIDYVDNGVPTRSMTHKPIYTCEVSKAMQDYENGVSLWLDSLLQR